MTRYFRTALAILCLLFPVLGAAAKPADVPQNEYALTLGEQTFDPLIQALPISVDWGYTSQTCLLYTSDAADE